MSEVMGTIECSDENTMKLLKHIASLQSELDSLKAEMADYREALSFYADKDSWDGLTDTIDCCISESDCDDSGRGGKLARSALAKHDKHKGEQMMRIKDLAGQKFGKLVAIKIQSKKPTK